MLKNSYVSLGNSLEIVDRTYQDLFFDLGAVTSEDYQQIISLCSYLGAGNPGDSEQQMQKLGAYPQFRGGPLTRPEKDE